MAKLEISTKRLQINKANATMVTVISVASFVTVFSLVSARALLNQRSYQNRVIAAKTKARNQLNDNAKAVDTLETSYKSFVETPTNILGGNPAGSGPQDGDNARIVLDALPSQYDFPALATSLEKILGGNGYQISGITGSDQSLTIQNSASPTPTPQTIPFSIAVTADYGKAQNLINLFERSIRPIDISKISLSGGQGQLSLTINANTFYQPAKSLSITTKEVQ